jgi:hypothetical protein
MCGLHCKWNRFVKRNKTLSLVHTNISYHVSTSLINAFSANTFSYLVVYP